MEFKIKLYGLERGGNELYMNQGGLLDFYFPAESRHPPSE